MRRLVTRRPRTKALRIDSLAAASLSDSETPLSVNSPSIWWLAAPGDGGGSRGNGEGGGGLEVVRGDGGGERLPT